MVLSLFRHYKGRQNLASMSVTLFFLPVSHLQGIVIFVKLINWQIGRGRPLLHTSTHLQTDTPAIEDRLGFLLGGPGHAEEGELSPQLQEI